MHTRYEILLQGGKTESPQKQFERSDSMWSIPPSINVLKDTIFIHNRECTDPSCKKKSIENAQSAEMSWKVLNFEK